MNAAPSQCANELGRLVVTLPSNATLYSVPHLIGIAIDATPGAPIATIIGANDTRLRYKAPYVLISTLCSDRAQRVVDHRMVVNGRPVTPECYLGLWRSAVDAASTPQQLAAQHGLSITAVLDGPLAPLFGTAAPWTSSPFPHFDDFYAAYARNSIKESEGRFRLELDLRQEHAARDAYYADSFMSSALGHNSPAWSSQLVVRGAVAKLKLQQGLFEDQAAEA